MRDQPLDCLWLLAKRREVGHQLRYRGRSGDEQGFLVGNGNPLKIASIADVAAKGARMAQRPKGAGAPLLLLALLKQAKAANEKLAAGVSRVGDVRFVS